MSFRRLRKYVSLRFVFACELQYDILTACLHTSVDMSLAEVSCLFVLVLPFKY